MELTQEEYAQATHDRDEGILKKCLGCLYFEPVGRDCCYSSEGHCDRKECDFFGLNSGSCDNTSAPTHDCRVNCLDQFCPLDND